MTDARPAADQPGHAPSPGTASAWSGFGAWAVVGAGLCLGLLSILSIGVFVLAATVLIGLLVTRWRRSFTETFGVVSGVALPLFWIAYDNRAGPGEICTSTARSISCTDEWNPWPWVLAGALLALSGIAAFVAYRHHTRRRHHAPSTA